MIHPGLILKALGWQAVGTGMLAKYGMDRAKIRQNEKAIAAYYAPLYDWWDLYGSPEDETMSKINDACKLDGDSEWIDYVCRTVTPVNRYIEDFLKHPRWPTYKNHGYPMTMMYYACYGKAARVVMFGELEEVRQVPSGNLFSRQDPNVREQIVKLLDDYGLPDLFWYTERADQIIKRLDELSHK